MQGLQPASIPLGTGPPTREELDLYYPGKFTWEQMKLFVNAGDLGLLKRDKALQKRYFDWAITIRKQYGSMVDYLLQHRLQWGKPDSLSRLKSAIVEDHESYVPSNETNSTSTPREDPPYFTADTPREYLSIIQNDWPYSVPSNVEHTLIWTRIPIFPLPHLIPPEVASKLPSPLLSRITKRIEQDGMWGFTGSSYPPPSPSLLPQSLGALSEWGVTMDKLIISPKGAADEEEAVLAAGAEVQRFVENRWNDNQWETAWFVNPPRLQSVKGLAHIHVFARRKDVDVINGV